MRQNLSCCILVLILGLKEDNSQTQVKMINPILIFKCSLLLDMVQAFTY